MPKRSFRTLQWSGEHRRRVLGPLLAILFLSVTHLPGLVALAAPQVFSRIGPGVSSLPASVAAFNDPSFGEISDAVNVATGNAYIDLGQLNRNTSTSTAPGSAGGTVLTSPTNNSTSVSGTFNVSGVMRLGGFSSNPNLPVPQEYALGVGDGSQELYRRATDDEVNNAPSWIKERYAGYRANTSTVTFISKPQVGVQTDETYIVVAVLGNNVRIAHHYDHQGNRTTFYGDGEYVDFTQTPHEQYRTAKFQGDYEGIGASAPKTEFTYTGPGNGHLRKVKDSWGRVTTYNWDEGAGVVTSVNQLLKDENDDNSWMRRIVYSYDVVGNQRVVTYMAFWTEDGRGSRVGRWFGLNYRVGTNNEILLHQIVRPVLDTLSNGSFGVGGGKATTYAYDAQNRVVRTSTLGEPDTTFTYGQAPAETGSGGLQVSMQQGDKLQIFQFTPEGWLRNHSLRNFNPHTNWDYDARKGVGYGANTMSWYDASGRIVAQSMPSGQQVQRTYDRHGNLKTEAIYRVAVNWNESPPAGYERLTRYTYDRDNQVTQTVQEAASGQGRSGDAVANDAAFNYGQVVKNYTYLRHDPAIHSWASFGANSMVGEELIVNGASKRVYQTRLDVYGRTSNSILYTGGSPYKNVSYGYPDAGRTDYVQRPSSITVTGWDQGRHVLQYGDLPLFKDSAGNVTYYTYDEWGNVVRELNQKSHTYKWDGVNAISASIHHWFAYNGFGQRIWEARWEYHPESGAWPITVNRQWHYYNTGELNVMWDGMPSHMTDYRYDENGGSVNYGRVTSMAEGIGDWNYFGIATQRKLAEYGYDAYGRVNSEKVDGQFTTTYKHNTLDQVVFTQFPDGSQKYINTHNDGQLHQEMQGNVDGRWSTIIHNRDSLGREILTQTPTGDIHTFYDSFDRVIKVIDKRLTMNATEADRSTYFRYDTAGNLLQELKPAMSTAGGQSYTDARRPLTIYEYDALDRVTAQGEMVRGSAVNPATMELPSNAYVTYVRKQYDVHDRPIQVTDQDGYVTKFTYDNVSNLTAIEKQVWHGSEEGRAFTHNDFDWVTIRTAYDGIGRPTQHVDGRGYSKRTEYSIFGPIWTYDQRGIGVKNMWYTPDGLLQGKAEPNTVSGSGLVTTEWRDYDNRQFPARIYTAHMNKGAGSGSGARTDFVYDYAGRPVRMTLPPDQNGVRAVVTQAYHTSGEPLNVTDANGFNTTYEYSALGQLTAKHENSRGNAADNGAGLAGGLHAYYQYDAAGNMVKSNERGMITEYRFNSLGKIIGQSRPRNGEGTPTNWKLKTYTLTGLPTALTSFDYAGNLASVPDVTDPWDGRITHTAGNMTMPWYYARGLQIGEVSRGAVNGGPIWEHSKNTFYDGLGNMYFRKFWGSTSIYAQQRDARGVLTGNANYWTIRKYDQNGNLTAKWDTPTNNENSAPLDGNFVQNRFDYSYTPTNKEATIARNVVVKVEPARKDNVLYTTYGGSNGVVLAASVGNTNNEYNSRDLLSKTTTTESTPHLDGNTPPRQDVIGNAVTRHQRYSYYQDGRIENSWTGNGSNDEGYKGIIYDERGREINVYDSTGGPKDRVPSRVLTNYAIDGTVTNEVKIESSGVVRYRGVSTPTLGALNWKTTTWNNPNGEESGQSSTETTRTYSNGSTLAGVPYTEDFVYTAAVAERVDNGDDSFEITYRQMRCPSGTCYNQSNTYNAYGELASFSGNGTYSATYDTHGALVREVRSKPNSSSEYGHDIRLNYDKTYMVDSRGNRLRVSGGLDNNFIKRYDADGQVTNYHKLGDSNATYFGNRDVANRYNDFRYDPAGRQILSSTAQLDEMDNSENGKWLNEHAVFRDWNIVTIVNGEVQATTRRAGSYIYNCEANWFGMWCGSGAASEDGYRRNTFQFRDATYSLADGYADDTSWDGTRPFAVTRTVMKLDAPVQSLSGILKINPLDLTMPQLPKLVDPSKIGDGGTDPKSSGASLPAPSTQKVAAQPEVKASPRNDAPSTTAQGHQDVLALAVAEDFKDGEGFSVNVYGYVDKSVQILGTVENPDPYSFDCFGARDIQKAWSCFNKQNVAQSQPVLKKKLQVVAEVYASKFENVNMKDISSDVRKAFEHAISVIDKYVTDPSTKIKLYESLLLILHSGFTANHGGVVPGTQNHLYAIRRTYTNSPLSGLVQLDKYLSKLGRNGIDNYLESVFLLGEVERTRGDLYAAQLDIVMAVVTAPFAEIGAGARLIASGRLVAETQTLISSGAKGLVRFITGRGRSCVPIANSFSSDTPVMTLSGLMPIAALTLGSSVLAFNEQTGQNGYYPITAVITHGSKDQGVTSLTLIDPDRQQGTELITTTPGHPFYVKERSDTSERPKPVGHEDLNSNWVGAGDLKIGDKIKQADGTTGVVANVTTIQQTQEMFNLTVSEAHTFYVGGNGWLVHNAGCLTPSSVKQFVQGLPTLSRQEIITQLKSAGLELKGMSPDGNFMEFVDGSGRVRVKVHPPDKVTQYDHAHIYDAKGNPIDINLKPGDRRDPGVHILIKP